MSEEFKVDNYYDDIFKWSLAKTKNYHDAQDLTQEIIFQSIKAFSRNELIKDPVHYLWRIAYYTWHSKVQSYIKDKNLQPLDQVFLENIEDADVNILKKVEAEEVKEYLKKEINNLGLKMQKCVIYYYYYDLSIKEVSDLMEISQSLVKYYLYEARKRIRSEIVNVEN